MKIEHFKEALLLEDERRQRINEIEAKNKVRPTWGKKTGEVDGGSRWWREMGEVDDGSRWGR